MLNIDLTSITSYEEYKKYLSGTRSEYFKREGYGKEFLKDSEPFTLDCNCYICRRQMQMLVDYSYSYENNGVLTPNWRETVICPLCGLNNRMRASIHLFEQLIKPDRKAGIYISEQVSPLYRWFANNYSNVVGSEYLGTSVAFGMTDAQSGLRNESLAALSFPDSEFDHVLSFDVFEHIPDFLTALRECHRILKHNGSLFFSVPFDFNSEKNIIKAVKKENSEIEYFVPPEYHGDPINPEGCLAFRCFGWEMLQQLKETGFAAASANLYWSQEFGYLGHDQAVFIARKSG